MIPVAMNPWFLFDLSDGDTADYIPEFPKPRIAITAARDLVFKSWSSVELNILILIPGNVLLIQVFSCFAKI